MALTSLERRWARNQLERIAAEKGVPVTWLKAQAHAGLDAIEGRWDAAGTQTALSNDIEAAAPGVFSVAQKRYLAAVWLILRGDRERSTL